MRIVPLCVLVLAASVAAAPVALAQNDDAGALRLYEAGRRLYAAERFDEALALFEESWVQSGRAELLYDIGECHDRLGHDAAAAFAFERYVAAAPNAPNRPEVEVRIRVLRARPWVAPTPAAVAQHDTGAEPHPRDVASEGWFWALIGVGAAALIGIVVSIVVIAQRADAPSRTLALGTIHID